MRILTLTINPALDKSAKIPHLTPEIKLKCSQPTYEPGGGGINVSRAIRKLGGDSFSIFQSGGPAGYLMEDLLITEGIKFQATPTKAWTRENLIITDSTSNQQYRFGMPGPTLSEDEWKLFLSLLMEITPIPEIIVASGSLPVGVPDNFYARVAGIARELSAKLILDTSGSALYETIKQERVFMLKPNLQELGDLAGQGESANIEQEKMALQLVKKGKAEVVIVSLGAKGAMMATSDGIEYVSPGEVKVKSTVGAGDSMVAGLTLAHAKGESYTNMLKYGVACGTAAAMSEGTELCSKENTDEVYKRLKVQ